MTMNQLHQKSDSITKEELKKVLNGRKYSWEKMDIRKVVDDESRNERKGRQDRYSD